MITNKEFVNKAIDIAKNMNTIYMKGGFGRVITNALLEQYQSLYPSWYNPKMESLSKLVGKNYRGFDCLGLIKFIFWSDENGNVIYQKDGVPDTNEVGFINLCSNVSTNMKSIELGEMLYMNGHVGIYIGDNKVCECTTAGTGNVQITSLSFQKWEKHGKLPYVDYAQATTTTTKDFKNGDVITLSKDAKYVNGASIPSFVFNSTLYFRGYSGKNIKFSTQKTGAITGVVEPKYVDGATVSVIATDTTKKVAVCPYNEPTDVLYQGCNNTNGVLWLQWHLVKTGFMSEKLPNGSNAIDGDWGSVTSSAFLKFQQYYTMTGTYNRYTNRYEPDGRCGNASREKLKSLL